MCLPVEEDPSPLTGTRERKWLREDVEIESPYHLQVQSGCLLKSLSMPFNIIPRIQNKNCSVRRKEV